MKKIIFFAMMAIMAVTATAQHYRGFADFTINCPISNTQGVKIDDGGVTLGGTTSHGVQVNKLYVGAGAGILHCEYAFGIPAFAEGRWDFFRGRTVNFFASVKLGYVFSAGDYMSLVSSDFSDPNYNNYYIDPSGNTVYKSQYTYAGATFGSIYFHPSVGVRFRITSTLGVNLALSYLPLRLNGEISSSYTRSYYNDMTGNHEYFNTRDVSEFKFWSHRIALSVGLDF